MPNDRFQVSQEQSVQVLQLALPDQMDGMEIDGLIDSILRSLDGRSQEPWVLDLTEVTYMGSAMLGLMVNIRERIRQGGGKLVLCGLSTPLMRIFQTCCLERLFNIAKTKPEAIAKASR
jgi:anti-anti-sigma factor